MDHEHNERTRIERVDPLLGEIFDRRFRIEARIAAGGFGAIYRATHIKSGHQLALKVLHANLTDDPGVVARFRREGAALTRLRDPHTITAYELGEAPDGQLYIVMELLRGESLYERFRARGALPWQRVVAIARDVCSSLTEAHALGIIHRDLKPTNIHLEPRGPDDDFVKVLDFGIAKILQDSEIDSSELTHAGQMIGTLDYMSPEQMVGGMCGPASDIYTLGIVLYEMIAGRKPFDDANSAAAALAAVLTTTPARLSVAAVVPADVDRIVMKCIERHHTDRYQSAAELAAELDEILASGEDAVTTVDLAHPRGAMTTLKGMRMPAKPPPAAPDAEMLDLISTGVRAPAVPAPPRPRLTPIALASPGAIAPAVSPRLTPTAQAAAAATAAVPERAALPARITPVVQAAPLAIAAGPERAAPLPKLVADDPDDAAPRLAPLPRLTPIATSAPIDPDTTLVGQLMPPRAPASRQRPNGTPQAGTPIPVKSLREAYPNIHRPVPSPTRPQTNLFDERPASSLDFGSAFDMSHVVRRDAFIRRVVLAVGIAVSLLVMFLIARRW